MEYSREQQVVDLAVLDQTLATLSARRVGEKQIQLKRLLPDFVRIHGYFAARPTFHHELGEVFYSLAMAQRISGLELLAAANCLEVTRKAVQNLLFRHRRTQKTCLAPNLHKQRCYCANLARYRDSQQTGGLE